MRSAIRGHYSLVAEILDTLVISMIYHKLHKSLHYVKYIYIIDYVTGCIVTLDNSYFIREPCICRYSGDFSILISTKCLNIVIRLYSIIMIFYNYTFK